MEFPLISYIVCKCMTWLVLRLEEQLFSCVPRPQDGAVGLRLEHVSPFWSIQTRVETFWFGTAGPGHCAVSYLWLQPAPRMPGRQYATGFIVVYVQTENPQSHGIWWKWHWAGWIRVLIRALAQHCHLAGSSSNHAPGHWFWVESHLTRQGHFWLTASVTGILARSGPI